MQWEPLVIIRWPSGQMVGISVDILFIVNFVMKSKNE
jgi:hypothetical protein